MSGARTIVADLPPAAGAHRWGRALGRETLDLLLLEQARALGVEVLQPWCVQAVDGVPGDWHCRIKAVNGDDSTVLHARVAIDAHGSWQPLPSAPLGGRPAPRGSDLLAFKANFRNTDLAEGLLPVLAFDGGYGGMVVADRGVTTVACCIRRERLEACRLAAPGVRAGEVVEAFLLAQCGGACEALQSATRVGPWLAAGPLSPGIRVDARDGPFRIGNAAGEAHPIIGEGMSMALQSAWLLGQCLAAQGRPSGSTLAQQRSVAERYVGHWRRQFGQRMWFAAGFAHLAMRPRTSAPLAALAQSWTGMLTLGARIKAPLPHAQRT